MKKEFAIRALSIMVTTFIVGIILVFSSGKFGQNAGNKAIRNNGGSMDTASYERVIGTTALSYQIAGGILSLVGGGGILISGYAVYKEM